MNKRMKIWVLGCGCAGFLLTCVGIWIAFETWTVYKGDMTWLVANHLAEFMVINERLPFDGRELNIWFGREIGQGDRLPPQNFEGGLFSVGNSDEKLLKDMTRIRVNLLKNASSFNARLELMRIAGKMDLQTMLKQFKDVSSPFGLRYEAIRKMGIWLTLAGQFNEGGSTSERRGAIDVLWEIAQDGESPFCGIALYGLLRNVHKAESDKVRCIIRELSLNTNAHIVCRVQANYLLKESSSCCPQ